MKKSTIITIFIIYLASIVIIGFFGIKVRVDGEIMYIETINLDIKCEDETSFEFRKKEKTEYIHQSMNANEYVMFVDFSKAQEVKVEEDGEEVTKKQLVFSIIPTVSYLKADSPDAEEDTVVYTIMQDRVKDKGYAEIDNKGILTIWGDRLLITILVSPKSTILSGSQATIDIFFD